MKHLFLLTGLLLMSVFVPGEQEFNPDLIYAQVIFVKATETKQNVWSFAVTVRHKFG